MIHRSSPALAPLLLTLVLLVAGPTTHAANAADWPQYRGPDRTGISTETGWTKTFGDDGPPVCWRAASGSGYSGLTIVDGTIFSLVGRVGNEFVVAWDAATGQEKWVRRIDDERRDQMGSGPRSTPVVHDGVLYAVGARGELVALDPATGEVRWAKNLEKELGARIPTWGVSASPLIEGGELLLDVGSEKAQIAAFGLETGEVLWTVGSGIPGYSTPIAFDLGETRQAVFFTGDRVVSVDPRQREILWTHPWKTSYDVNAATPIFLPPNRLFVSSGYDTGAAVLEIAQDGRSVREVWSSPEMKNQFSSSVADDGWVYGFHNRILKSLRLADGETGWQQRGFGHGSLLLADGHLIVLGEKGELAVVEATPERYVEKASAHPLRGKHWTVPTLWDGRLFVRNESELVCFDLSARSGDEPEPRSR